jgi:hypothetical protein
LVPPPQIADGPQVAVSGVAARLRSLAPEKTARRLRSHLSRVDLIEGRSPTVGRSSNFTRAIWRRRAKALT